MTKGNGALSDQEIKAIRNRAFHYLTNDVSSVAGIGVSDLQQFACGAKALSDRQMRNLAARMHIKLKEDAK